MCVPELPELSCLYTYLTMTYRIKKKSEAKKKSTQEKIEEKKKTLFFLNSPIESVMVELYFLFLNLIMVLVVAIVFAYNDNLVGSRLMHQQSSS